MMNKNITHASYGNYLGIGDFVYLLQVVLVSYTVLLFKIEIGSPMQFLPL